MSRYAPLLILLAASAAIGRAPVIHGPDDLTVIPLESTDLARAGNVWIYRFPLKLTALSPVLGVKIGDESVSVPYRSNVELEHAVLVRPGDNRLVVRAFTDTETFEKTFTLHLEVLEPLNALPAATVAEQPILIFRPVDHGADVLQTDALLEVGGGRTALIDPKLGRRVRGGLMYDFVVEVSAFSPIRSVRINGQVVANPQRTWTRASLPVLIPPEGATVVVEAATDRQKTRETFPLALAAARLPGSPLYVAAPDWTPPVPEGENEGEPAPQQGAAPEAPADEK